MKITKTQLRQMIKEEMSQLHKDGKVEKGGHTIEFNESTKEYGKTLDKIAKDRQLKSISKKDRDTLIKIAKLMKRANESVNEGNLKYVIQYKKDKNRYLSNKSRDVKKVKDALQFKSEKDAKNQLNGLDWQFRGNYKIVKLKESVEETQLRNMIREELTYLNEETEFKVFYKGIRFTVKGKDLYNAKKDFISKNKVPMSKWGTLAIMSKKSYDDQQFRYENINEAIVKPSKVQSEVNKIKKRLIKKAESGKFYENFGQKEVDKLEDKYIDISSYTVEMNKIRDILTDFRKWARNYSPN